MEKRLWTNLLILFLAFGLSSCGDDEEEVIISVPEEENDVSTLLSAAGGNDCLSLDTDGNIYVSDYGTFSGNGGNGTRVYKITPEGERSVFVDGLLSPVGNAFDPEGNFYVCSNIDGFSKDLIKVTPSGEKTTLVNIGGRPSGIVSDENGNLYISNYQQGVIHKYTTDGVLEIFATDSGLAGCVGIVYDGTDLYTANYDDGRIFRVSMDSTVTQITQLSLSSNNLGVIGYITLFKDEIYATGIGNNKIYKVQKDGTSEEFSGTGNATSINGSLMEASYFNPNGIVGDEARNIIYVMEFGAKKLRKIQL